MITTIFKDIEIPKLTIAKDRITFKLPNSYNPELYNRIKDFGDYIIGCVYNEDMKTLRGRFYLVDDKFTITLMDDSKEYKTYFVE